jgi:hypothetical protein
MTIIDAALYSNLQLDLSRGLFPFALPYKFLKLVATFLCILHATLIKHFLTFFFPVALRPDS